MISMITVISKITIPGATPLDSRLEEITLEQLNANYSSWAKAKSSNFDKPYRATENNWGRWQNCIR